MPHLDDTCPLHLHSAALRAAVLGGLSWGVQWPRHVPPPPPVTALGQVSSPPEFCSLSSKVGRRHLMGLAGSLRLTSRGKVVSSAVTVTADAAPSKPVTVCQGPGRPLPCKWDTEAGPHSPGAAAPGSSTQSQTPGTRRSHQRHKQAPQRPPPSPAVDPGQTLEETTQPVLPIGASKWGPLIK